MIKTRFGIEETLDLKKKGEEGEMELPMAYVLGFRTLQSPLFLECGRRYDGGEAEDFRVRSELGRKDNIYKDGKRGPLVYKKLQNSPFLFLLK